MSHFDSEITMNDQLLEYHAKSNAIIPAENKTDKGLEDPENTVSGLDTGLISPVPDMWTLHYVGLYSQYAIVGLLYGMSGTMVPLCSYVYNGDGNTCANARSVAFFAWNFKLLFALGTDATRPFGMRRKPFMLFGMSCVILILLFMTALADKLSVSSWLAMLLLMNFFLMFSDVPADGYSVELGHLEPIHRRGQILATGQRVRFTFCMVSGFIQTFLLNGPTTNAPDCTVGGSGCWSWGLTVNGYYGLIFALCCILFVPICFLRELDTKVPPHTLKELLKNLWLTMQNLTTMRLIIFVIGFNLTATMINNVNIYLQYYIIKLSNFQAGIDTITSYLVLVIAIWIFQRYLINRNWRITQYSASIVTSIIGLLWIPAYYNAGGTQNAWYTIFIDLDQSFSGGLTQVLTSMCVIELARQGEEASTFELIISVNNTTLTLSTILATQLLVPFNCAGCTSGDCASNTVDISSVSGYNASNGPYRFTTYNLALLGISIGGTLLFTPFLPSSKTECAYLKERGEQMGKAKSRAWFTLTIVVIIVVYGFIISILLINPKTACLSAVGGSGC